ncbi:MAG: RdgB/HAM1 family non-canonical purine NTP pyrophosphatase [Gammaproteobacteria bacterium]|jgi:XTP/dITP diphosphohydrolase|nr:RdgB/HAM1 family non-canonical purine NTP pyrophosphatase [Gammaproteobacteria bacterium]MBQ0774930.1 RdgB/HAM1 family non-canonical purine NTP pyrophosphatase [Gammaproteobacteria bacterium]|tara:strand:- start:54732 stop:55346 length:615 start_codon:yes stop_codon:yes gene_type:complete
MKKIVLASGNKKKIAELQSILKSFNIEVIPQSEFDVPEAEETGLTFIENAILKARNAAAHTGLPAIADDSGIEVDALNGAPGIYSARFSADMNGDGATDEKNNALLVEKLRHVPTAQRTARYQAVIVLMRHSEDPTPLIAQGSWEGTIELTPRGESGFGYDPHFLVPTLGKTAAQLSPAEKQALSHRGNAMAQLVTQLINARPL